MSEEVAPQEELTEEEKGHLRSLVDTYKEAMKKQREFCDAVDLPRVHRILAAKGAPLALTLLFGAEKAWAEAVGYTIPDDADGVYASFMLFLGAKAPTDVPQLLLAPQNTPALVRLIEAAFHSMVRLNGLPALNPLLDIAEHLMVVVSTVRKALDQTGQQIQAAMQQAQTDAALEGIMRMPPAGEA